MRHLLGYIFFFLFIHLSSAAQVSVTSSARSILLGEQFTVTYSLTIKVGEEKKFSTTIASVRPFEIIHTGPVDSTRKGDRIIYAQQIRFTSFDTGRWVIPSRVFHTGGKTVLSDTLMISVMPVKLTSTDYYGVKEIIQVQAPANDWFRWIRIAGMVLAVGFVFLVFIRIWRKLPRNSQSPKDPYLSVIAALDKLSAENDDRKSFYTSLYNLYRAYFSYHAGMDLVDKSTDELIVYMKSHLSEDDFYAVTGVLRVADVVKFANYPSSTAEGNRSIAIIREAIRHLHQNPLG